MPRKSKLREHRDVRDDEGLLIRHFAGAVCYHTVGLVLAFISILIFSITYNICLFEVQFIDKNNDALHASLEYLIQDSKSPLLKRLFQPPEEEQNGNSLLARENPRNKQQGKLGFISVGSKFRSQLKVLMEKLDSTVSSMDPVSK